VSIPISETILISQNSTPQGSPASMMAARSSSPMQNSPSPNPTPTDHASPAPRSGDAASTPTQVHSSASGQAEAAKRKRKTPAEKDAFDKEQAEKKQKRDEERIIREAEKQIKLAAKMARQREKEAEKAEKDAEKQARAQEREEKRKQKEEEERRAQAEKEKKARSQTTLASFFGVKPSTPKKSPAIATAAADNNVSPGVPHLNLAGTEQKTEYEIRFRPFFIQPTMYLADNTQMDEETRATKCRILDECVSSDRDMEINVLPFKPTDLLQLPKPQRRGRIHVPVKHTMEKMAIKLENSGYSSIEAQRALADEIQKELSKVPVKFLGFREDVRPPYRGTVTLKPFIATKGKLRKAARHPAEKILPLDYSYDSEAEWQDEEEGEDLDMDDGEEDMDGENDMDDFLDDSEDTGLNRRLFSNGMEPESTGLCWENRKRWGPNPTMYKHRMEFILGKTIRPIEVAPC
jgi:chromatin assembly factor 1 subunit A